MKNPPIRKSLGQHFLNDRRILERVADALELHGTETVVEIGPGRGGLTDVLAPRAGRLWVKQRRQFLQEIFASVKNLRRALCPQYSGKRRPRLFLSGSCGGRWKFNFLNLLSRCFSSICYNANAP